MSDASADALTRLAIVAQKHSGKTTLANALIERGWTRLAIAEPIKRDLARMLSFWLQSEFPALLKQRHALGVGDVSGRITLEEIEAHKVAFVPLLQAFGQWARDYLPCDGDIWINCLTLRIIGEEIQHPGTSIVVDDCRLPEEAEALRAQGFFILRLMRPELERLESIEDELIQRFPLANPQEWYDDIKARLRAIAQHKTETDVERIVPDARIWCESTDEVLALAERIAQGELPS